ncbi:MAG: TolC family protein [Bacteroidetes bacterium]|nr:TolC family protein [Bacteroidota bacterium]
MLLLTCQTTLLTAQNQDKQTVLAFTLQQAQDYAYENNFDLKNSATDVRIAGKMVKQNTAIGLPQINGSASYMDYLSVPTMLMPNFLKQMDPTVFKNGPDYVPMSLYVEYNVQGALQLNQLIYSGQYLVGLQTAKAYLETAKQKNLKDKVDIRDQVANAYYQLLVTDEAIKILDSTYVVVSRLVDESRKAQAQGLIEDIDVDQADLNRSNLEAQLTDVKSSRNIAYANLKFVVGLKDNQEMTLSNDLAFFLAQVDRDVLINQPFDYQRNIDYTLLKKSDYLTLMQYKLSKTAYQPTLAGFLGISANASMNSWAFFSDKYPWYRTTNWGLSLQVPIWSSGSRKYAVDQARLNVEKTKVADEKMRVGLELQVETAKKDFSNAFAIYLNQKKGFDIALKIYTKTMTKYRQGLASSTDLNQRYTQFLTANSNYMQSIFLVLSQKTRLNKLIEQF